MSVEHLAIEEFIGVCESEAEKRKWFQGLAAFAKTIKALRSEQEKADRERAKTYAERDAAVAEIATKQKKYEADIKAALADLERVTQEKADAATQERAQHAAEIVALKAQTDAARTAKELAEAQLAAFLEEADRETLAVGAGLKALRAEERAIKERLGGFAATLKG